MTGIFPEEGPHHALEMSDFAELPFSAMGIDLDEEALIRIGRREQERNVVKLMSLKLLESKFLVQYSIFGFPF